MEVRKAFMNSCVVSESANAERAEHREDAERQHPRVRASCPDCNCDPTHPTKRARYALPFTPSPSISPASMPRQSKPRDDADDRLHDRRRRRSRRRSTC